METPRKQPEEKFLTRVHKNEVFAEIQRLKLDPADFRWERVVQEGSYGTLISRLVHVPTKFHFTFSFSGEYYTSQWWPPQGYGAKVLSLDKSWEDQAKCAFNWLVVVKKEADAPDLWGSAFANTDLLSGTPDESNNEQFTPTELRSLEAKLDQICEYIQETHAQSDPARETIGRRISFLKKAALRVGRIDWTSMFIGQIVSMIFTKEVLSSAFADIMRFAGSLLQGLIIATNSASRLLK
jgi:hypothetical protein